MKKFARSAAVQRALASLFSGYLKFCYATLRWKREGREHIEAVWKSGGGVIICFWHARIPLAPPAWEHRRAAQEIRALISRSADGEFIAVAMEHIGFPAIRGSRRKLNDPGKDKGGVEALREMARWVKAGNGVAITPDGPNGPAEVMAEGAPTLGKVTGAPLMMLGLACRPCLRLKSWDRTILPVPFARAAMVWAPPLHPERQVDNAEIASAWTDRLRALTEHAEQMLS